MALINPQDLIEGDIFEKLGLQNLSDQQKEETMTKLIEGVQSRVVLRIDDLLTDEDRPKFEQLLESGNDEQINAFLSEKGINVPQLTAEEALLLKSQIIESVSQAKE